MIFSLILVFLAVLLTGISQVLLKIGAGYQRKRKDSFLTPYLNLPTLFAYGLLFCATVITVIALKEIPLKVVYSITSLGFIIVLGLSSWQLKEKITKRMMVAIAVIVFGVIIFNFTI
jgi:multidrug transporter EmrE-like cation transporter